VLGTQVDPAALAQNQDRSRLRCTTSRHCGGGARCWLGTSRYIPRQAGPWSRLWMRIRRLGLNEPVLAGADAGASLSNLTIRSRFSVRRVGVESD
jgi:hypothetical protein